MAERQKLREVWSVASMILLAAEVAERGNIACIQTSSGKVIAAVATTPGQIPIGTFMETKTPAADAVVKVELFREVRIDWFANDTGGTPVVAGDVGSDCYVLDGATVTGDNTTPSVAGKVWGVDAVKGVAVQIVAT